ncbi:MAG: hypothetical protein ACT4O0_11800 [Pseudonocardia sp.]|jgi:uncharacterized protein involved in propanediol utilization
MGEDGTVLPHDGKAVGELAKVGDPDRAAGVPGHHSGQVVGALGGR